MLWFTGLPGSGKTTLARALVSRIRDRGLKVEHLDGDEIRSIFPNIGFTREERNEHLKRMGFLASRLERNGIVVVASFVSPYRESRDFARALCRDFVEAHVSTPLAECERRDPKGMYRRARLGELPNFTGVDDPYEEPLNAEIRIDTTGLSLEEAVSEVEAGLARMEPRWST